MSKNLNNFKLNGLFQSMVWLKILDLYLFSKTFISFIRSEWINSTAQNNFYLPNYKEY